MNIKNVELNITLECNWKCPCCCRMCDINNSKKSTRMNMNDIQNIISSIKKYQDKFDHIKIIGGEPTIHPDFVNICLYIRNNLDIEVLVATNGSNNSYNKLLHKNNIKTCIWRNLDSIEKKFNKHVNFRLSPLENNQEIKSDCGEKCGIGIFKYNNKIYYCSCVNQFSLAIMLNKMDLLYYDIDSIFNNTNDNNNILCKNCQFIAKKRILFKDNNTVSKCFVDGLKKFQMD